MVAAAALVLLGVAAPDRDVAAGRGQRLRDAEADAAIAAGDDGDAAGEVENAHEAFPVWFGARWPCVRWRADVPVTNHGQGRPKIKYGFENRDPLCTAERNNAGHNHEETNAVQARHARFRRPGRHPEARPSGGDERGVDGHAGRPCRGARRDRRRRRPKCAASCITGRGARVLHRRQSAGPRQPEAGQEQRRRGAGDRRSIRSCAGCATCIARSSPRSTVPRPAPA